MRKTILGCVSGAALGLALAACGASSSSPAAAISQPAGVAPPSPSSCSVVCVNPVASTNAQWYAQVSGALGQVQDDLTSIQADMNSPALTVDGTQLAQDAQAALSTETDPAPVDNADFVTAMNDYIAAGNDYSGYSSSGQQNIPQANQEVSAAQAAVRSFNAAQQSSAATPATSGPATTPAAFAPGSGFNSCGSGVYAGPGTSCPFALAVYQAATADGNTPIVTASSSVTGQSYSMTLTSTSPVTYEGGNNALVEWAAPAVAAPGTTPAATAPATVGAASPPVPDSAPKVTVWCGSTFHAFSAPNLTVWKKNGQYNYSFATILPSLKNVVPFMENSGSPAAAVDADTQSICLEVISAFNNPPPVDYAQYKAAMDDYAQGAYVIHTGAIAGSYPASQAAARKYFSSGLAELNAFLAAVGP
jgi:hypothetical protein